MGSTRCSFVPYFGVRRSAGRNIIQCSLYISATSTPRRKASLRAIMISQEVDLVAGDFNGTAWRHRGKDNLSTTDEAFMDSILPTPPGPIPLWDLDPFRTFGPTSVDVSNRLALRDPGK